MNADNNKYNLKGLINAYAERKPVRFHMPGHKGFIDDKVLKPVYPYDVTEISETDDLYRSNGVIENLQQRFAKFYSAKASFLLVNGSTAGNIAMLLSLGCEKRILLGRDCHCSALSGIALADHEAISVFPDMHSGIITPQIVEKAFSEAKEQFDAVFLTSPNYYGKVIDVERIAEIVHSHGALLFIDAAHGAHFPFSDFLPENPSFADAWVVSCHKTLNSLTQTAVLNLGVSCPITPEKMLASIAMIQTSSPSFILMRSLEDVLDFPWNWDAHCKRIIVLRKELSKIKGLLIDGEINDTLFSSEERIAFDLTRFVFSFDGINGFMLNEYLEQKGIFAEMCDARSVVLITSPADPDEWYVHLYNTLSGFSADFITAPKTEVLKNIPEMENKESDDEIIPDFSINHPHIQKISVREAMLGDSYKISIDKSEGKICAHAVGIYPPGTAILFPGEQIGKNELDILKYYKKFGAKLFGVDDGMICVLDDKNHNGEKGL